MNLFYLLTHQAELGNRHFQTGVWEREQNHSLQGEWSDFQELHLGGDLLLIYQTDEHCVYLTRLGSHTQLFKSM